MGKSSNTKKVEQGSDTVESRDALEMRVRENWNEILEAQIQAAKGINYETKIQGPDGETNVIVYSKAPDLRVGQYLIDQVVGKPKERMDIKGNVTLVVDF